MSHMPPIRLQASLSALATLLLWHGAGVAQAFYAAPFEKKPSAAALTELGRKLFSDRTLSASGTLSCASCHDPAHAFGPPDGQAVQRGGVSGRQSGVRAVPSLTYTQNVPPFSEHFVDDDGDDSVDQGPAGGRTWDGRATSAHEQALLPLLSPFEMANSDARAVIAKVRRAAYAAQFRDTFGGSVLDDEDLAFKGVLWALEVFQQSPADFYPYDSKYDAWLRGQTLLSAQEERGLAAFNDPRRGNCASCHISSIKGGAFPQFTDYGFAALAVPRNAAIPANADPRYYDLGLCGPLRADLQDRAQYCGLFRTPSLRNVARRHVFFHNGVVSRLEDAVRFYAERDTHPERWYPRGADGQVRRHDDLPARYADNIEKKAPFGGHPGGKPALTMAEVKDIVAFLRTLTDGWSPKSRAF